MNYRINLLLGMLLLCGCGRLSREPDSGKTPQRIVSMAPSVTETLFALGLGGRVVGVSRYCDTPPEVAALPKVGGFVDPNLEAIARLQPDLVILLGKKHAGREPLEAAGITTFTVAQNRLDEILESITLLAERCGVPKEGERLLAEIADVMGPAAENVDGPRVLVCVGHVAGGRMDKLTIAGRGNHYDGILRHVGAQNAYDGDVPYPQVGYEGLMTLKPDLIIDLVPDPTGKGENLDSLRADWQRFDRLKAVQQGRVSVITNVWAVRPSPGGLQLTQRIREELEAMQEAPGE